MENSRIRIEPHIEAYLKTHSERILDKASTEKFTVAELGVIANTLLMEHKQATKLMDKIAQNTPLANLFNWLTNLGSGSNKVIQLSQPADVPALSAVKEDFDFEVGFSTQFDQEDAA